MIKVSDYVAQVLSQFGIRHVFMVTGGGSMHLNDSLGNSPHLQAVFCHHEQACAMAAESYFRISNRLAAVNVTSGPGGTNAITGVYGAYVDSMGMIVISGQVKWETLVRSTSLNLRQLGDQEADIVALVEPITKYAAVVSDPATIRYHLEKALHLAVQGRPGPCWLDIPMNVQATKIDPENLRAYDAKEDAEEVVDPSSSVEEVLQKIRRAARPVILAGTGVRLAKQYDTFLSVVRKLGIPVLPAWNSNDLLPDDCPVYAGRPGTLGIRAGNFTLQNSDFLLILGSRANLRHVSYNWENFAPRAFKVMVDIDPAEMKKPTLSIDLPICANLAVWLPQLERALADWRPEAKHAEWLAWCRKRLELYPVTPPEYWAKPGRVNPYCFMQALFDQLEPEEIIVSADGTACVTAFQAARIKPGQRLFHNSGAAPMGYDLPAVIGVFHARSDLARIICVAGDGSIMMNLQELQTIVGQNIPAKIFLLNNQGYHSIRQTQNAFFAGRPVGCGVESGLTFPDFRKIAEAFGLRYLNCAAHNDLAAAIAETLQGRQPAICEIFLDLEQAFAPKLTSRQLEDGRMVASSLEDMAPFLDRAELKRNMLDS